MPRNPLALLALLAAAAGCETRIAVIDVPGDASADVDGGSPIETAERCEPAPGAAWEELEVALTATEILAPIQNVVAMHGGTIVAAGRNAIHASDAGGPWRAIPWDGLPEGGVEALVWHDGAWAAAIDRVERDGPQVFRHDAAGGTWISLGTPPGTSPIVDVVQLVSIGGRLLAQTSYGELFVRDGESWTAIVLEPDTAVMDVVTTGSVAYASSYRSGAEITIFRSRDGLAWEPIAADAQVDGADLVAGPAALYVVSSFGFGRTFRLEESEGPDATLRLVAEPSDDPTPIWIAADGTVLAIDGRELYAADAYGAPLRLVTGIPAPPFEGTGAARFFRAASEGSAIVIPRGVDGGTQILRSDDRARTFASASGVESAATVLELASDDRVLLLRARAGDGAVRTFVLGDDGAWIDVGAALPDPAIDGVTGLPGRFVTRTPEYARVPPYVSTDGARTWSSPGGGFPRFDSNAGEMVRQTNSYAIGPDGALYAGTVGGVTSICCTGSKVGWGYRSGSGIWRVDDAGWWSPVNAGIPIESGPDPLGGPPFRSDVRALASTGAGTFASLVGRGVYRLEAGRWSESSLGLPIDETPRVLAIADTAAAWWPDGLAVREGEVWIPRGTGSVTSVVARADLLVRAADGAVAVSRDLGATWEPLPPLGAVELAITRDRIYARTGEHRVHALAIECTEGSR